MNVLFLDDHLVAVSKPAGLFIHRTPLNRSERTVLLQSVRDHLGRHVFPVHRLDRPTSGVVVFGLSSSSARAMAEQFVARTVRKRYLAVVRGFVAEEGVLDEALPPEPGLPLQEAITAFRRLATGELPVPVGPFPTARYSLVEARPRTGRPHQIRRHLAHAGHPVVGDVAHGDNRHNHLVRDHLGVTGLLLHAFELSLLHPVTLEPLTVRAPLPPPWDVVLRAFGWEAPEGAQV